MVFVFDFDTFRQQKRWIPFDASMNKNNNKNKRTKEQKLISDEHGQDRRIQRRRGTFFQQHIDVLRQHRERKCVA